MTLPRVGVDNLTDLRNLAERLFDTLATNIPDSVEMVRWVVCVEEHQRDEFEPSADAEEGECQRHIHFAACSTGPFRISMRLRE